MNRHVRYLDKVIEGLLAIDLAIMVVLLFSNVVARYGFGSGFAGAEEIARLLFVWMVFLGAILGLKRHAHLGVELVQERLPRWARRGSAVVSHLLMLYALWLFLKGSWAQTIIGTETYSTVLHYPNSIMASAGLVCAASMVIIVLANLVKILIGHPAAMIPGEPAAVAEQHLEHAK